MSLLKVIFYLTSAAAALAQSPDVVTVTTKMLERKSKLPAEFQAYQTVDLHARVAGYVQQVEVDVGSAVRVGQLLVTLVAPEMQAALAEAQARVGMIESQKTEAQAKLVAAQSTYERIKTASETPGAVAANEMVLAGKAVDAAKAVIQSLEGATTAARSAVDAQKDLMSYLKVTAPFDGVITERWAHPGALAGGTTKPMLRLEQHSRLRLIVAVPEAEVGGIARGVKVSFTVPSYPGETFTGMVARNPGTMDAKTRSMPVELDVTNPGNRLAPGMYAEVQWPFRRPKSSLLVPPTSVVTTTERTFVIRVKDGHIEWVNVTKGTPAGDLIEVFGPLREGDQVVKRGSDEIREK